MSTHIKPVCGMSVKKKKQLNIFKVVRHMKKTPQENSWRDIKRDNVERQCEISQIVKERWNIRNTLIKNLRMANLKINLAPGPQDTVEQCRPVFLIELQFWN